MREAILAIEREAATPPSTVAGGLRECAICGDYTSEGVEVHEICLAPPSPAAGGLREAVAFYRRAALSGEDISAEVDAHWLAVVAASFPVGASSETALLTPEQHQDIIDALDYHAEDLSYRLSQGVDFGPEDESEGQEVAVAIDRLEDLARLLGKASIVFYAPGPRL
jgi:hypothetical protein